MGKSNSQVCVAPRVTSEPISIGARQAWSLMQAETSAKLIDTRSTMEFVMIGHPQGAVHIPCRMILIGRAIPCLRKTSNL